MKVVCIHQPDFAPYLGFFHRLLQADHFVILDDVQFLRRGWHHRDQILTEGGPKWLTLRVNKGPMHRLINCVRIESGEWIDEHLSLIELSYAKTPGFKQFFPIVEKLYRAETNSLVEFNMGFIHTAFEILGITVEESFSSSYNLSSQKSERLAELVNRVSGTHYLTGSGSRDYLDEEYFEKDGIKVVWQNFFEDTFLKSKASFEKNMSFIDFIMKHGDKAKEVFMKLPRVEI